MYIPMILLKSSKVKIKGSKISKTRAREGGASVFSSLLFPKAAASANRAIQQAGKKEGGWGEGIFARLLRKRSPAALLVQSRTQQKSFLFLLEEKIGRQIKKCEENFFAGWRALASGGGAKRQFLSKKFRARFRISHQTQLSPFWERIASGQRPSAFGLCALRKAKKSHGGQKEKEMNLSFSYLK